MSAFIEFLKTQKNFCLPAQIDSDSNNGYMVVKITIELPVADSPKDLIENFSVRYNTQLSIGSFVKIKVKKVPCTRDRMRTDDESIRYHPKPKARLEEEISQEEYEEQVKQLGELQRTFDNSTVSLHAIQELFSTSENWFRFNLTLFSLDNREEFRLALERLNEATERETLYNQELQDKIKNNEIEKENYTSQTLLLKQSIQEYEQKNATLDSKEREVLDRENCLNQQQHALSHDIAQLKAYGLYKEPSNNTESIADEEIDGEKFKQALAYPQSDLVEKAFQLALVSSLIRGRMILLEGSVGVGKTYLAENVAERLGGKSAIIPVRPSWGDSSDIFGFFDPLSKIFRPAAFTEAICNAPQRRIYPVILDEMNLARIENYGADLLSRIEKIAENRLLSLNKVNQTFLEQNTNNSTKKNQDDYLSIWSEHESLALSKEFELIAQITETQKTPELMRRKKELSTVLSKFKPNMSLPEGFILLGTLNADESTYEVSPKVIDRSYILSFPNLSAKTLPYNLTNNDVYVFSTEKLRQEFIGYETDIRDDWEQLNALFSDSDMNKIGIPYSHRLITDFSDLFIFCKIMGYAASDYMEAFVWSRILPRISYFKSDNDDTKKAQESAFDALLSLIPTPNTVTERLKLHMQDENRNLVKFFGR